MIINFCLLFIYARAVPLNETSGELDMKAGCCSSITISGINTADATGKYTLQSSLYNNHVHYVQSSGKNYIYFSSSVGNWHINDQLGSSYAKLYAGALHICPSDEKWYESYGQSWIPTSTNAVKCETSIEPPPVDDSCARGYIYDYLEGFGICFEPGVFESEPRLRSVMTKDLAYIVSFLPAKQYEIMSDIKYYINKDYQYPNPSDSGGSAAVFHVSAGWLSQHGNDPAKATHVEIYSAQKYVDWRSQQPSILFHETAHGYSFRTSATTGSAIRQTYNEVIPTGIYDMVEHVNGQKYPAYALTNPTEYFAEISEAFFSGEFLGQSYYNDFYAFNLSQLKTFDPKGYRLCLDAWETYR